MAVGVSRDLWCSWTHRSNHNWVQYSEAGWGDDWVQISWIISRDCHNHQMLSSVTWSPAGDTGHCQMAARCFNLQHRETFVEETPVRDLGGMRQYEACGMGCGCLVWCSPQLGWEGLHAGLSDSYYFDRYQPLNMTLFKLGLSASDTTHWNTHFLWPDIIATKYKLG